MNIGVTKLNKRLRYDIMGKLKQWRKMYHCRSDQTSQEVTRACHCLLHVLVHPPKCPHNRISWLTTSQTAKKIATSFIKIWAGVRSQLSATHFQNLVIGTPSSQREARQHPRSAFTHKMPIIQKQDMKPQTIILWQLHTLKNERQQWCYSYVFK